MSTKIKICANCGEERRIHAKGLCGYCYAAKMRQKKYDLITSNSKEAVKSNNLQENKIQKKHRPRSRVSSRKKKPANSNKAKKRQTREKNISYLKGKLWRIFSKFIRLRDSNEDGYCTCFTSGKVIFWKSAQAGHFMSRKFNSTFVHEKNVHAQSAYDNLYLSGAQYVYGKNLDLKYGEGTADYLVKLSKEEKRFTAPELNELITYYTAEVKRLAQEKNIKI